jgi:hypothetical protein
MKNLLIIFFAGSFVMVSCRKERTCSCTTTGTTVSVTTPKNGGASDTETSSSTGTSSFTNAKMKKDDMKRFADCNSRTETSTNSYTTTVWTGSAIATADVKNTYTTIYDCEID